MRRGGYTGVSLLTSGWAYLCMAVIAGLLVWWGVRILQWLDADNRKHRPDDQSRYYFDDKGRLHDRHEE